MCSNDVSVTASSSTHFSAAPRIAWLDGWRGLAILSVLFGHFGAAAFPEFSPLGGYGVELFFVLSGRLMADILFVERHPIPDFFRRRFARIFPALLVFATTMALSAALANLVVPDFSPMRPWEYFAAITFTINYVQALGHEESRFLAHIWSLSVEEHSYVVLALLALAVSRSADRAKWLLAFVGILALLNGLRLDHADAGGVHQIYWRTDVRVAPVFLSASVYLFLLRAKMSPAIARGMGLIPLIFVPLSLALFFQPSVPLTYTSSAILLAISVNLLKYSPVWLLRCLSARILVTFGLLSYSIYLWQQPFFRIIEPLHVPIIVALVGALCCGVLSYFGVERPARRWINGLRFTGRPQVRG